MTPLTRHHGSTLPYRAAQSAVSPTSFRWTARHFSSSASLRKPTDQDSPRTPGPPGGFPGGLSGRSWGTLGSGANRPTSSSLANSGLLPHERQARLRAAETAKPLQVPPKGSISPEAPKPPQTASSDRKVAQDGFDWKGITEITAKKQNVILADAFKTGREPRQPPTPKSWTTEKQDTAPNKPAQASETAKKPFSQRASSFGLFGDRKATIQEPFITKPPTQKLPVQKEGQAWGAFRNRRVQTEQLASKPAAPSQDTRPAQQARDRFLQNDALSSQESQKKSAPTNTTTPPKPVKEDFWDALESRFAHLNKKDDKTWTAVEGEQVVKTQEDTKSREQSSKKAKKPQKAARPRDEDQEWDEEEIRRWEERQRKKAEKAQAKQAEAEEKATRIFLPEYISISNLASSLKQRPAKFLRDMEEMGFENITPDTIMTGETAALVAMEYGFDPTIDTGSQRDLKPRPQAEDVSSLPGRPPIVTIMGHVDHGKTTLLDWLRKSSIAAQEHGGITQHIGAFVVKMSSGKPITFLDTPGHSAFLSMRKRGANVTDIVVLVVAADDSVMPQTIEAIKHATAAKVPIIVAINKIDKEAARVEQVKADLARHGVEIEDFGGDVQVVCVSGKTGKGMEDLEENILTLSEVLDVRAETDGMAEGWVLESSIKQDGRVATVLVKRGTLRPGDLIVAGKSWARIRVLRNEAGTELDEAPPGTPVEILGWRDLPLAGERVLQAPDENKAKTAVEYRQEMAEREESSIQLAEQEQRQREKAAAEAAQKLREEQEGAELSEEPEPAEPGILQQNFVVKADVVGSVEAVCACIQELGSNEVRPRILRSSAGQISEYDVDHAATSNSVIVNFNLPVLPHIKQRADAAKVKILDHSVIYHVVDDAKAALSALLPDLISHRVLGEADVLQVFPINIKGRVYKNIAGCRIRNGSIKKSSRIKVIRKGEVIFDGKVETLKHVKKDVAEMGKGSECGIGFEDFQDLEVDDQIQTFEEMREKRTL